VTEGDPSHDLPACTDCHGSKLAGVLPAVPGLVGVSQYYLDAQLSAWRNETRRALGPDCMARIAQLLSASDLNAITSWLASQVLPDNVLPEPQPPKPPPMQCGSMPTNSNASPAP
jgi:cytochrome c553